jgi:hypothetical protein
MAEKHTVAMFIQEDGERKQVGWASPAVDGARTFEFSPGYADKDRRPSLKNVSFEDDELSQKIAAEEEAARLGDGSDGEEFEIIVEPAEEEPTEEVQEVPAEAEPTEENQTAPETTDTTDDYPQAGDEGKDSAPLTVEPNEELAAEPVENVGETVELDNGGEITDVDEDTAPAEVDEAEVVRENQQRRQNNQNRNRNNRGGNRNQGNN